MAPRTKNVNIVHQDDPMEEYDGNGDISRRYGCPFPIFSDDEGILFHRLNKLKVTPPHSLDWHVVDDLNIRESLTLYLKNLGLYNFATRQYDGYRELCLEMLCTFKYEKKKKLVTCRLLGNEYTITRDTMNKAFGFTCEKDTSTRRPSDFNVQEAWKNLSGFDNWNTNGVQNGFVKDPVLAILQKFIAYNVSRKEQANKVNANEVYLLWAAQGYDNVCISSFIWTQMNKITNHSSYHPSMSNIATGLARELKLQIPLANWRRLEIGTIGYHELKNASLIEDRHTFEKFENRNCVRDYLNEQAANLIFTEDNEGDEGRLGAGSSHRHVAEVDKNIEIRPSSGYQALREDLKSFEQKLFQRLDTQDERLRSIQRRVISLEKKWNEFHRSSSHDQNSAS